MWADALALAKTTGHERGIHSLKGVNGYMTRGSRVASMGV